MSSSEIKTALIVLSYNGLDTTKMFMSHFDANTNQDDVLLIMIDNGSSDGSAEYLSSESQQRSNMIFVANSSNLGIIDGRNYGYAIYSALSDKPEYLMFLDNDQYVQKDWLTQHHAVLKESKAAVVGVEAWLMNNRFYPVQQAKRPSDPWTYVGCGGMLMSGKVPDTLGMFDSKFNPAYFEDPDFCFRIMENEWRIAWNYKAKVVHMAHQTLGKNNKKMEIFRTSYGHFCDKWKHNRVRPQRQEPLPCLRS